MHIRPKGSSKGLPRNRACQAVVENEGAGQSTSLSELFAAVQIFLKCGRRIPTHDGARLRPSCEPGRGRQFQEDGNRHVCPLMLGLAPCPQTSRPNGTSRGQSEVSRSQLVSSPGAALCGKAPLAAAYLNTLG